jgi:hypothetical protein
MCEPSRLLRGGSAEAHERRRPDHGELGLEREKARRDLPAVRLRVDAALAPKLVAEMLDRVGDVHLVARDSGTLEPLVEDATGRADERMPLDVLAVAGLPADEHHARVRVALAHDRLRGLSEAPKIGTRRHRGRGKIDGRHHRQPPPDL